MSNMVTIEMSSYVSAYEISNMMCHLSGLFFCFYTTKKYKKKQKKYKKTLDKNAKKVWPHSLILKRNQRMRPLNQRYTTTH